MSYAAQHQPVDNSLARALGVFDVSSIVSPLLSLVGTGVNFAIQERQAQLAKKQAEQQARILAEQRAAAEAEAQRAYAQQQATLALVNQTGMVPDSFGALTQPVAGLPVLAWVGLAVGAGVLLARR